MSPMPILLLLLSPGTPQSETFTGEVTGISDGDTFRVLKAVSGPKQEIKVRLHGIDCPELKQPFGTQARAFTADAVFRKWVTVEVKDRDQFGRTVAWVTFTARRNEQDVVLSLNEELVKSGLAWWFQRYAPDLTSLRDMQHAAQSQRVGLWSGNNPVAPWLWKSGGNG